MNFDLLNPTVYERAAASVLNAKTKGVAAIGLFCAPDAEPYACWAIATAVNGNADAPCDDDEPHVAAFREMFCPLEKGLNGKAVAYFWGETATVQSQNERALALLLMAEIVRSEGKPSAATPA